MDPNSRISFRKAASTNPEICRNLEVWPILVADEVLARSCNGVALACHTYYSSLVLSLRKALSTSE